MDYDDNYSTDSSEARERDAKKAIEEVVVEEEVPPVPEYTDEEMKQLLTFIVQMVTIFDMNEEDVTEKFNHVLKEWILNVNEKFLFIYYDGLHLTASYSAPINPVYDLTYFIRDEIGMVFTVSNFHDEVTFGTVHENVEETMLHLVSRVYAPLILNDPRWSEHIKATLFTELHSFLAFLTDLNSKLGSMVVLYIPNESHDKTVGEAVEDKPLIKRLESIVIYWMTQIRLCLNDVENLIQNELTCASDEYEFWIYKHEVLNGIELQIQHPNIQHILQILEVSQSLFIKQFKNLMEELNKEIVKAKSNAAFLNLLVGPCADLQESDSPVDVPSKLPHIIYLIRVISLNSDYYNNKHNTERLFYYLSNEIIKFCISKVDLNKIFTGNPRFGIQICDMCIDCCCISYKLIFRRLKEDFALVDFKKTWLFDDSNIFNQINIFLQRLYDIIEICETIIVFGRIDETVTIPPLNFGCHNAPEFKFICSDIEQKFENGLKSIKNSSDMILNVHNRQWYNEITAFKSLIRSLEEVAESLMVNVFLSIDNIEEALDILTALYNFSKRKNLQNEYLRRVNAMWKMFENEIAAANMEISRSDKERPYGFPNLAGKAFDLKIRLQKIERLKQMLFEAHFLPEVPIKKEVVKMLEITTLNINSKMEKYNYDWMDSLLPQPNLYLQRNLLNRSSTYAGLLECNIDRNLLPVFDEFKYFDFMEFQVPSMLIPFLPKADRTRLTYNKVVNVILIHNRILCMMSDTERLLFKALITATDRKLNPGLYKLTYQDENPDAYALDCLKSLDELQNYIDVFKIINMAIVKMFESISNTTVMSIKYKHPLKLDEFKSKLQCSLDKSVKSISEIYGKAISYLVVIYEGFDNYMNEMLPKWTEYIKKFDTFAEYAFLSCCKNTLNEFYLMLHGKNNMSPDPVITLNVNLREKKIVFEPEVKDITNCIVNLYRDIIKTIRTFPRLMDKFELKRPTDVKNFYEVIELDADCANLYCNIKEVVRGNIEKMDEYLKKWNSFRDIWEVDIEEFTRRYKDVGIDLDDFETALSKYFDISNQVLIQDTISTITFLTVDCSKLKIKVLEFITKWKNSYKEILCYTVQEKLKILYKYLEENVEKLLVKPYNFDLLKESLQLHEKCMIEIDEKEKEVLSIEKYYACLEKYDIGIPKDMSVKFNGLNKKWIWYNAKLKEIEDTLYNLNEQFKMGLLSSVSHQTSQEEDSESMEKNDEEKILDSFEENVQISDDDGNEKEDSIEKLLLESER